MTDAPQRNLLGDWLLGAAVPGAFVLFVLSFALEGLYPFLCPVTPVLLAGFVGGATNTIAIRMMFHRRWYLPGSGVIEKKRDVIIAAIADTVAEHILNPETLQDRLAEALREINVERITLTLNALAREFRDDAIEYVNSEATLRRVAELLRDRLGTVGWISNAVRYRTYESMAREVLGFVDARLRHFEVTEEMVRRIVERTGTLEEFAFQKRNPLVMRHYGTDRSLAELVLERVDVRAIVAEKLSAYPTDRIRDIVETHSRKHLRWLEAFGVLLGWALMAAYAVVQAAMQ